VYRHGERLTPFRHRTAFRNEAQGCRSTPVKQTKQKSVRAEIALLHSLHRLRAMAIAITS
jgi:hypothetical protein